MPNNVSPEGSLPPQPTDQAQSRLPNWLKRIPGFRHGQRQLGQPEQSQTAALPISAESPASVGPVPEEAGVISQQRAPVSSSEAALLVPTEEMVAEKDVIVAAGGSSIPEEIK